MMSSSPGAMLAFHAPDITSETMFMSGTPR